MTKIFLVGYRAVGKTTLGAPLAKALDYDFIDLDQELCRRVGATVNEIVKREGWSGFRLREGNLLLELAQLNRPLVVATGGGAVLHTEIWPAVKREGMVVWLTAPLQTLVDRLRPNENCDSGRPSLTGESISKEVEMVLAERTPLYRAVADYVCATEQLSIADAIAKIIERYRESKTGK